jgi:heat shock protein HslJ
VASPLYGVTWRLQEINSKKALPGVSVTAVFGAEKTLSGSGGCNRYSGGAIANDGKLTVTPLATTMMFCGQAGVADQEVAYFSALGKATAYSVTDTELRLTGGASGAPLVFARE